MFVELPESIEAALTAQANAHGVSPATYAREILQRNLAGSLDSCSKPLESGRGMFVKYGLAPSAEEIDENRAAMFRGFGEGLD